MHEPDQISIDVDGAVLGALRWPGEPAVVAVHGITANAWSWAVVADRLADEHGLGTVALDLRGRGLSAGAPAPFGMRRHADDVAAVVDRLDLAPAVVAGHSMGCWVSLMAAERHPATVADLVLVDGGVSLPRPEGADPQEVLEATIGPALRRLRTRFPDRDEYRGMWEEHPAFAAPLSPEVERYVMADLVDDGAGTWRSCVSEDAVRFDGGELFTDDEVRAALDRREAPVRIVRAELGLFAEPPPLIPAELMAQHERHDWHTVEGTNHYDVLIGPIGAEAVADAIVAAIDAQR